jgi:hypothetical protein
LACPFFVPREIVNDGSWPHPARLPLGAGWTGTCCASNGSTTSTAEVVPTAVDAAYLRDFCNLGYAAGCPHLPGQRDWDAVRFSVASSGPEHITLTYICERAHAPVEHGTLTFDLQAEVWRDRPGDPRVRRLADSFLYAWRLRRNGAPA